MAKLTKEEEYFQRKNKEVLERLAAKRKEKPRPSPITGEPMIQEVINGVVVDRCKKSGGVWLDAGELEQLIEYAKKEERAANRGWLSKLFTSKK